MSIQAVVGRIDQIYQLQQQILDPSAATAGSASDGGAAVSSGSSSSNVSTDFATALANAQQSTAATSTDDAVDSTGVTDQGGDTASIQSLISALNAATAQDATGTTGGSGTDSTTSTDPLLSLLAADGAGGSASTASGVVGATTATGTGSTAPVQVDAMIQEANSLVGKPYVWGGGHSGWGAQSGYDCSGFVSAVLHAGGYLSSPQDTETLPTAAGIASGPGQYVTIYDRTTPGQEGHVIIDIAGQFYESGGESGTWGGGGGVEKISTPPASYLATFNTILHPEGL